MAQQIPNVSTPNDDLGTTLRNAVIMFTENDTELYSQKVDKVVGKGLSDTNFTQVEKDKLADLDPAFQAQTDWDETNPLAPGYLLNRPENTSDFTNDGDGVAPFIPDVIAAGIYVRQAGIWVLIGDAMPVEIMDGFAGVTAGFAVGQLTYTLPVGKKAIDVYLAHSKQYKITPNNGSLVNRWSQTGAVVTLTKAPALNNYVYIEYQ